MEETEEEMDYISQSDTTNPMAKDWTPELEESEESEEEYTLAHTPLKSRRVSPLDAEQDGPSEESVEEGSAIPRSFLSTVVSSFVLKDLWEQEEEEEDLFSPPRVPLRSRQLSSLALEDPAEQTAELHYSDLTAEEKHRVSRAAVYVELAINPKEKRAELTNRPFVAEIHWILHNTSTLRQLLIVLLLLLAFFEVPSWCYSSGECGDRAVYPSSSLPKLSVGVGLVVEFFLLADLLVYACFNLWRIKVRSWRNNNQFVAEIALLGVSLLDVVVSMGVERSWRVSPFLRPMVFVCIINSARESVAGIFSGLKAIAHLLVLLFFWVFFMAWMGCVLFGDVDEPNLTSLQGTMMNLMISLTAANFPDVAIGALTDNLFSILFFVVFLVVGLWGLMNVVLATIYTNFRKQLEIEEEKTKMKQVYCLKKAFIELNQIRNSGYINCREMRALFKEMNIYFHIPFRSQFQIELFIQALDTDKNGKIFGYKFLKLLEVMDLQFKLIKSETFLERHCTPFARSKCLHIFAKVIRSVAFEIVITLLLITNIILLGLEWFSNLIQQDPSYELIFTFIFFIEMILKMIAHGGVKEYWKIIKNRLDGIITIVSFITEMVILSLPDSTKHHSIVFRLLQVTRLLRLLRLPLHFPAYQTLTSNYLSTFPHLLRIIGVVFIFDYFFCLLGIALYGGKMNLKNPLLNNTDFLRAGYIILNFNDFFSGFVTLFSLKVVNNWFVVMGGYVAISSDWSRVYFVMYWVFAVVVILSVVVALTVEYFSKKVKRGEEEIIDPMLLEGIKGLGTSVRVKKRLVVGSTNSL